MSESVPTSVTSFAHRRTRADSIASFTYLQVADDAPNGDEEALMDEEEDVYEEDSADFEDGGLSMRRKSSTCSRGSVHDRLLRSDSGRSESHIAGRGKLSQKIYIANEDLTIVVAGFMTSRIGYVVYGFLCTVSFGLAYLLFRWIPRWEVWLTGSPTSLRDCTWVVIEVWMAHSSSIICIDGSYRINGASLLSKI